MSDTISVMTEDPEDLPSGSTTVTISSTDTSSDASRSVSFRRPSRSAVWKYFRRRQWSAQCMLCKKVLSYNGGTTSNLMQHLNTKHQSQVEVQKPKVKTTEDRQLSITQFAGKQYKGKSISKPCSVETKEEITRILTKWTWKDMRPISIVRDNGFVKILKMGRL